MAGRKLTPKQAARMLLNFEKKLDRVVIRAFNVGLRQAHKAALKNPSMQGLGKGKNARPPNPPPGPLGIRTGRLRRAVDINKAKKVGDKWIGGLKVDLNAAPYGAIHEFGGTTSAHVIRPVNKSILSWMGPGGVRVFARKVNHPGSRIPARPYLGPALKRTAPQIAGIIDSSIAELGREFF